MHILLCGGPEITVSGIKRRHPANTKPKNEGRYEEMSSMNEIEEIPQKVYEHMKSFMDKHGITPTVRQISEELHLMEHEVKEALDKLHKSDKIVITKEPDKTTIKFKA